MIDKLPFSLYTKTIIDTITLSLKTCTILRLIISIQESGTMNDISLYEVVKPLEKTHGLKSQTIQTTGIITFSSNFGKQKNP